MEPTPSAAHAHPAIGARGLRRADQTPHARPRDPSPPDSAPTRQRSPMCPASPQTRHTRVSFCIGFCGQLRAMCPTKPQVRHVRGFLEGKGNRRWWAPWLRKPGDRRGNGCPPACQCAPRSAAVPARPGFESGAAKRRVGRFGTAHAPTLPRARPCAARETPPPAQGLGRLSTLDVCVVDYLNRCHLGGKGEPRAAQASGEADGSGAGEGRGETRARGRPNGHRRASRRACCAPGLVDRAGICYLYICVR
jgi:hypothetical protein